MSHKNHRKNHHQHHHHWSFLAKNFLLAHFQNSRELVVDPRQTELLQPKEELLLLLPPLIGKEEDAVTKLITEK
jgi:hypothetical protein